MDKMIDMYEPDEDSLLCLKCGKCCKLIAMKASFDEFKKQAESGNAFAKDFIQKYMPYESDELAKSVDEGFFEALKNYVLNDENNDTKQIYFYYCMHLSSQNTCSIYQNREEECKIYPKNAWSVTPQSCGYKGWQFEQKERAKKLVRGLKELLYELSFSKDDEVVTADGQTVSELKKRIEEKILPWKKYGADFW
ncbi:MAG: YkgJ family cysteine cluster protein [Candidatus Gastranaerophilales bacterium]|nr:YkgJ family cysteine cluster protein [Candidatus Gastranaerophilales bacterium]